MVKGTLPDTDGGLKSFMGMFGIIFGVFFTLIAVLISPLFVIFGIVFVTVGIWNFNNEASRRKKFLTAKSEYEQRRTALQTKLKQRNYD